MNTQTAESKDQKTVISYRENDLAHEDGQIAPGIVVTRIERQMNGGWVDVTEWFDAEILENPGELDGDYLAELICELLGELMSEMLGGSPVMRG